MESGPVNALARGPVIVTDGDARAALAITRSLGARGVEVHVLGERNTSLAGVSRHARSAHRVPSAERDPAAWADTVARLLDRLPGAVVLPVTEVAIGTCFGFGLGERTDIALPPRAAYEVATDKHATLTHAREAGLDAPHSTLVEDAKSLDRLPAGHRYPVVLKARRSRWLEGQRWQHGTVAVVHDDWELRRRSGGDGFGGGVLVQEFVPGSGEGLFFLVDRGAVRMRFAHQRLREKPPSGGVSVLCESIPLDPELARRSEALLSTLRWHGLAMVELRRAPDGRAAVMEINPRPWGSLQLAIDAGVDFPAAWLAMLRGERVADSPWRVGVRSRWLLGDVDHLYLALRDADFRRRTGLQRRTVVARFLRGFFDGSHGEVARWGDLRPALLEVRRWLRP